MDAAFVAADDRLDMLSEERDGVLRGDSGVEPRWVVLVPAEIVAAGGDALGCGEVHEEIGLCEIEAVLFGVRAAPFHLVFGDQDGALVEEEWREVGAAELGVGDGGAEVEAFGVRCFAKLGNFGGIRAKRKCRGSQGAEGQLNEIATLHG